MRSMRKGDHKMTNLYFRRRLYAQAFTIAVLVAGNAYWQKDRSKRKDYNKLVAEKQALEKRDRWLRELEMRDEEEKAWQARVNQAKEGGESIGVTDAVAAKTKELKSKLDGGK